MFAPALNCVINHLRPKHHYILKCSCEEVGQSGGKKVRENRLPKPYVQGRLSSELPASPFWQVCETGLGLGRRLSLCGLI